MNKLLAILIMVTFGVFLTPGSIIASDLEVVCDSDGCRSSHPSYFFPESEVWNPGKTLVRTFRIENQSGKKIEAKARSSDKKTTGNLEKALNLYIKKSDENNIIWGGNLNDFLAEDSVALSDVNNNENQEFEFKVSFDPAAGNVHQGSTLSFNLIFSYSSPGENPVASQTPVPGNTSGDDGHEFFGGKLLVPVILEAENITGEEKNGPEVAGALIENKIPSTSCNKSLLWYLIPVSFSLIGAYVLFKTKREKLKKHMFSLSAFYIFCIFSVSRFFCGSSIFLFWLITAILLSELILIEKKLRSNFLGGLIDEGNSGNT